MGITIRSKRYNADMGYAGFKRFRDMVASFVGEKFHTHYTAMDTPEVSMLCGQERKWYFEEYNKTVYALIEQKEVSLEVASFLYECDCEGHIDRKQAKQIYELIKDANDDIVFGYSGRGDCAKMTDMKNIFNDKTKVEWR